MQAMVEIFVLFVVFAASVVIGLALGGRLRSRRRRKP